MVEQYKPSWREQMSTQKMMTVEQKELSKERVKEKVKNLKIIFEALRETLSVESKQLDYLSDSVLDNITNALIGVNKSLEEAKQAGRELEER